MSPDTTKEELAKQLTTHFAGMSQKFDHLRSDQIPTTHNRTVKVLSANNVAARLRSMNKPKSYISIDPLPQYVTTFADILAVPLSVIINEVRAGAGWPSIWSLEEVSIIPKKQMPENFDQCRNISCTSLFSKLCESFMVDLLSLIHI